MTKNNKLVVALVSLLLVFSLSSCCVLVCAAFGAGMWALINEYKEGIYVADFTMQLVKNISGAISGTDASGSPAAGNSMEARVQANLKPQIDAYRTACNDVIKNWIIDPKNEGKELTPLIIKEIIPPPAPYFEQDIVIAAVQNSVPLINVFNETTKKYKGSMASYSQQVKVPFTVKVSEIKMDAAMTPEQWNKTVNNLVAFTYDEKDATQSKVEVYSDKLPKIEYVKLLFNGNVDISEHNPNVSSLIGTPTSIVYKNLEIKLSVAQPDISITKLDLLQCGNFDQKQKDVEALNNLFRKFGKFEIQEAASAPAPEKKPTEAPTK